MRTGGPTGLVKDGSRVSFDIRHREQRHEGQVFQNRRVVLGFSDGPGRGIQVGRKASHATDQIRIVSGWRFPIESPKGRTTTTTVGASALIIYCRPARSRFVRPPRELCSRLAESIARQHVLRPTVIVRG